jgi:thymidylate synthase (FAD)
MKIVPQAAELLWITPNAEQMIELGGRVCYKSEDKITEESAPKFIEMVCKRNHESVLEHASASFRVICDRGVSHEIVRHRLCSFSQESTRYCSYSKDKFDAQITVICPPGLDDFDFLSWEASVLNAEDSYMKMISRGVTPQIARSVLPTCLKTEIVWTANFREWKHILKLRTDPAAHPQMREVAFLIQDILVKECPSVFKEQNAIL